MKVSDSITYYIHYHKITCRPNTLSNYEFLLSKFGYSYQRREINSIKTEEIE